MGQVSKHQIHSAGHVCELERNWLHTSIKNPLGTGLWKPKVKNGSEKGRYFQEEPLVLIFIFLMQLHSYIHYVIQFSMIILYSMKRLSQHIKWDINSRLRSSYIRESVSLLLCSSKQGSMWMGGDVMIWCIKLAMSLCLSERASRLSSAGPPAAVWQCARETTVTDGWVTDARFTTPDFLSDRTSVYVKDKRLLGTFTISGFGLVKWKPGHLDHCPFVNVTL